MNRTNYYIYITALLLLIGAATTTHAQTIRGNIYGGGQIAKVDGDTHVDLNTGTIHKDVFGGGQGVLNDDHTVKASADVTGNTNVTANGSTLAFPEEGYDEDVNHNVYGGGNLACVVGTMMKDGDVVPVGTAGATLKAETGNTNVDINAGLMLAGFMDDDAGSAWGKWIANVNTRLASQYDNYVQGSVFGGGYGVNTSVLGTAKVHVNVDAEKTNKAMVDVVGGGYNGYVLNNTDVTVQGVPEIYKIYGGGLGSHGGYDDAPTTARSHANLSAFTMQRTIGAVGENKEGDGTSLLIKGGKFYNDIFGGGAGLKYSNDGTTSYLNVAEVFGKTNVVVDAIEGWTDDGHAFAHRIYGGGALGMVNQPITVEVKSGWIVGGEVFAGSLGEMWHLDKALVANGASVTTIANSSEPAGELSGRFNVYGGCDMAQLTGDTHVDILHGTFSGNIFGGGKGLPETGDTPAGSEQFLEYGKVTGETNVLINGPQMTLGKATLYTAETAQAANDAHLVKNNGIEPGQPGYIKKYDNEWLEVKAGDAATINEEIKIYGGGALGLVVGTINPVNLQSGTLYGEVFGGSLGELGYLAKAKVTGDVGVKTTANDAVDDEGNAAPDALNGKFTIYGGCEMAQVIGTTNVDIHHGTFLGGIFGGGKGLASAVDGEGNITDNYMQYGKVEAQDDTKAACKVTFESDGSFGGDIYGGGALGLVETSNPATIKPEHITEVHLKKGDLNGKVFGAGLGEKIDADKAKVTGDTWVITDIPTDPATEILGGNINHVFGGGNMAQVDGNTLVEIIHGSFSGTIFGGGNGVAEDPGTLAGDEKYLDFGKVTETTHVIIDGPTLKLGSVEGTYTAETADIANAASGARENAYNYWKEGDDIITSTMSVYGGGALGMVGKNITVEVKSGEIYGDIFAGSLGELGYVKKAKVTADASHTVTIGTFANDTKDGEGKPKPDALKGVFSMYGGCDMAQFEGNSKVDIQHGEFRGQIFGGGRGVSCADNDGEEKYGIVKGTTYVHFHSDGSFNGDIYGGGALGLVQPTGTPEYTTQVHLEYGNINGQVFGGGFGEITNYDSSSDKPAKRAALNTAKVTGNTLVITDDPESNVLGGEINHVYGGGNMAMVDGNTRVEISHGSFSGTIFGGGNGVPSNATEEYLDFGKVTGTTYVLIDGADLELGTADYYDASEASAYNSSHALSVGDPDYKNAGDVKTVTSEMQIYGGGAMGMVDSNISVDVKSGKIFGAVFAGSMGEESHINKALVKSNSTQSTRVHLLANSNNDPLTGHFSVYGGCDLAMFEGESEVVINHGTFTGKIFGGGNGLTSTKTGALASGGEPKYGQIKGLTRVIYDNDGTFNGDIYGGGAMGKIVPDADAHLPALATDPITTVYLSKGTINGQVFGGSLGEKIDVDKAEVMGNTLVTTDVPNEYITGGAGRIGGRIENFFGGGDMARVTGDTYVTLTRGHFNGRIFGGGNGVPSDSESEYLEFGKVTGDTHVLVDRKNDEGNVLQLGENEKYTADEATTHNTALSATPGDVNYVQAGDYKKPMKIYGGGALGKVGGTINIAIKNGEHYGEVFGGSLGEKGHPDKALVTGNTNAWAVANKLIDDDPTKPANDALPLTGDLKFYGGCEMARVEGQSKVTINHGSFSGAIYGGGKGIPTYNSETYIEYGKVVGVAAAGADPADPVFASVVDFNNAKGTFTGNIYGGGALGKIEDGLANVQMKAGTVNGNIYGGSYGENTLPAKGTAAATLVEMLGGSVNAVADTDLKGEVYGGGALANIAGDTEVHLYGGTVGGNVFGGGLGNDDTYQEVGGDTKVILGTADYTTASVIDGGSIFGANNINGTPRGRSFVHVRKTVVRSTNSSGPRNVEDDDNTDSYDVYAVYGGGNLSAYQPSDATYTAGKGFATVLVENCDNSIAYVYGGGNAAPVPGTDVKIYGADAINHAFAGGNGKGVGNDGADVGYLNFYSTPTPAATEYGSGLASIAVYGGTVHNVYGGSNTLGYIREGSTVTTQEDPDYTGEKCILIVGNIFGGGNEADIDCDITMNIDCSDGGKILYAGANNADVNGNITLNIYSGTYEQVFCGNNKGGAVRGKLVVNVDEIGCTPIIIKELFGGGNEAPYSVYGYEDDGTCKKSGDQIYADPVINVTSCTAIGTIYGGGYGKTAVMYGNPIVNVDMVKGKWAKESIKRAFMVIKEGIITDPSVFPTIPNKIGAIGNIFGGGKEAAVYGNTTVNVCVKEQSEVKHPKDDSAVDDVTSANIAPLPEEFITYGLIETTPNTTLIDYQHANVLSSGMKIEGETTEIRTNIKIDNNTTPVNAINLKDSYASKQDQIVLSTTNGFKIGDKISVSGFYYHSESVKPSQIAFFYKGKTGKPFAVTQPLINAYNTAGEPTSEAFTLTEDADEIWIRRDENGGTSQTYIYTLNVTRPTFVPEEKPIGSIYGGGKMANVYGNTKVHIRNGNIEGDVYGAGQGDAGQPDAALVQGKTEVIIGEDE